MIRNRLEKLIGKLRSMYQDLLGTIVHLYHIKYNLTKAKKRIAYFFNTFHHKIAYWHTILM